MEIFPKQNSYEIFWWRKVEIEMAFQKMLNPKNKLVNHTKTKRLSYCLVQNDSRNSMGCYARYILDQ